MKTSNIVTANPVVNGYTEKYATKDDLDALAEKHAEFRSAQEALTRQLFRRTLWLSGGVGAVLGAVIVLWLRILGLFA